MSENAIDVSQAIAAAKAKLEEFYGRADLRDVRLEEVSDDRYYWYITLGFAVRKAPTPHENVMGQVGPSYERVYKIFDVSKETGEVGSMKIRET